MALSYTTILATNTPNSGREIENANFATAFHQLNNIANYLDSDHGNITGITNTITTNLTVATNALVITPSSFVINSVLSANNTVTVNGNLVRANIYSTVINNSSPEVVANSGIFGVGNVSTYPRYYTYQVTSIVATTGLTVQVYPAANGQEVLFVMVKNISGSETLVNIQGGGSTSIVLPSGKTYIQLNVVGQTVQLKMIGSKYYIIGGNGYSFI